MCGKKYKQTMIRDLSLQFFYRVLVKYFGKHIKLLLDYPACICELSEFTSTKINWKKITWDYFETQFGHWIFTFFNWRARKWWRHRSTTIRCDTQLASLHHIEIQWVKRDGLVAQVKHCMPQKGLVQTLNSTHVENDMKFPLTIHELTSAAIYRIWNELLFSSIRTCSVPYRTEARNWHLIKKSSSNNWFMLI